MIVGIVTNMGSASNAALTKKRRVDIAALFELPLVITDNPTYVVMNSERAAQIRNIERMRRGRVLFDRSDNNTVIVEAPSVPRLVREAGRRALSGEG